jgi:hypothetical protein
MGTGLIPGAKRMDDAEVKKRQDFLRELYLVGYDKATAFLALIVTAGYAGAFTVWDHVQRYVTYCERMLIAALLTASLTIFIGWQVRGQWVLGQQQLAIARMVAAGVADFPAMIEEFRVDQAKVRGALQRGCSGKLAADTGSGVFAQLAALLLERGWSSGDVRKVLGENFLRVTRTVWK